MNREDTQIDFRRSGIPFGVYGIGGTGAAHGNLATGSGPSAVRGGRIFFREGDECFSERGASGNREPILLETTMMWEATMRSKIQFSGAGDPGGKCESVERGR